MWKKVTQVFVIQILWSVYGKRSSIIRSVENKEDKSYYGEKTQIRALFKHLLITCVRNVYDSVNKLSV